MKIFNTPITILTSTKLSMASALCHKVEESRILNEDIKQLATEICTNKAILIKALEFDINDVEPKPHEMIALTSNQLPPNTDYLPGTKYLKKSFSLKVSGSKELFTYRPSHIPPDYDISGRVTDDTVNIDFQTQIPSETLNEDQVKDLAAQFKAAFQKMEELRNEINKDVTELNQFINKNVEELLEKRKEALLSKQAIDKNLENFQ